MKKVLQNYASAILQPLPHFTKTIIGDIQRGSWFKSLYFSQNFLIFQRVESITEVSYTLQWISTAVFMRNENRFSLKPVFQPAVVLESSRIEYCS